MYTKTRKKSTQTTDVKLQRFAPRPSDSVLAADGESGLVVLDAGIVGADAIFTHLGAALDIFLLIKIGAIIQP